MGRTAFISGHTDLTNEEFVKHYVPQLKNALEENDNFLTAYAFGADVKSVDWLLRNGIDPKKITVYLLDKYIHKLKTLQELHVNVETGFGTHLKRDEKLTEDSDYDITWLRSIEDSKHMYGTDWSKGSVSATEKNILRRERLLSFTL